MTRALYYPGADRTSRWFGDDFPGVIMATITKLLLHSTETRPGGCPGYDGGAKAPTLTVNPWPGTVNYRKVWQHFKANQSARALVNPDWTPVPENKDDVAQIEILGYSDKKIAAENGGYYLPDLPDAGLDFLADVIVWWLKEWPIPNRWASPWPMYPESYGNTTARMTSVEYDTYQGVLAHLHASGNLHGDVSLMRDKLKAKVLAKLGAAEVLDFTHTNVRALQSILEGSDWFTSTDMRAMAVRAVAYEPVTPTELQIKTCQRIVDVDDDGVVGPKTLAALAAHVQRIQDVLGVGQTGIWGPWTEKHFQAMRKQHRKVCPS